MGDAQIKKVCDFFNKFKGAALWAMRELKLSAIFLIKQQAVLLLAMRFRRGHYTIEKSPRPRQFHAGARA